MQTRRWMRILSLVPFVVQSVASQQSPFSLPANRVLNADVDIFIDQVLADWNSAGGVAVVVVRKNERENWDIETKGYGIAKADGTKVDEHTLFNIGSNSKLFTAMSTGLLISNKSLTPRLSWSTKIASIVPEWQLMDSIASAESTIMDVMSHRTGLPSHDMAGDALETPQSLVKRLKYLKPSAEFRETWQYNNHMYTLMSYLPTAVLPSRIPFARYVKDHIFDPLGMASTTYSYERAEKSGKLADGMARLSINRTHDPLERGKVKVLSYWDQNTGEDGDIESGAGGVISSAVDMVTWLQCLLLEGKNPRTNESVIPAEVVQKVATGISVKTGKASYPELSATVYGAGQIRSSYRGHELIEHGGDVPGFHSQISRFPYDGIGIAVLCNDDLYGPYIRDVIKFRLMDEALGLKKIDWNTRYKEIVIDSRHPAIPRPSKPSPPSPGFESLAGLYNNLGYGTVELCLSPPTDPATQSCKALLAELPTILPGAIDPNVPAFVARWNKVWSSHVVLTHFDGNVFNGTVMRSIFNSSPSESYWAYAPDEEFMNEVNAEFTVIGGKVKIGLTGFWGAGADVEKLSGDIQERAEVWFDKI